MAVDELIFQVFFYRVRDLYIAGHDQDKADFNFQQPLKDGWTVSAGIIFS